MRYDVHGRMMSIGTRQQEQVWIAMVPNEWLVLLAGTQNQWSIGSMVLFCDLNTLPVV